MLPGSCDYASKVWFQAKSGDRYVTLQDTARNDLKVADCWVEMNHQYAKSCALVPASLDSVVRCAWKKCNGELGLD
jgi:hypothetical protein